VLRGVWGRGLAPVARPQVTTSVRLDRAGCRSCRATHVLLPAGLMAGAGLPARSDRRRVGGGRCASQVQCGDRPPRCPGRNRAGLVAPRPRQHRAALPIRRADRGRLDPDLLPTTPRATALGNALHALAAGRSSQPLGAGQLGNQGGVDEALVDVLCVGDADLAPEARTRWWWRRCGWPASCGAAMWTA
jgi:hypothetical protein